MLSWMKRFQEWWRQEPLPDPGRRRPQAANLFIEYMQEREDGSDPSVDDLLRRAGIERAELEQKIDAYQRALRHFGSLRADERERRFSE